MRRLLLLSFVQTRNGVTFPRANWLLTLSVIAATLLSGGRAVGADKPQAASSSAPEQARKLFLTGKYGEATEAYQALLVASGGEAAADRERNAIGGKGLDPANKPDPDCDDEKRRVAANADARLGLIACQLATGDVEATMSLAAGVAAHPTNARFPAELAKLDLDEGQLAEASKHAAAALALDKDQPLAHYVVAVVAEQSGKLDEAEQGYHWFVDYYNQRELKDPDVLRVVGLASAQYARWRRLHQQFSFLVNDFWADVLAAEPNYWPARYEAGRLYLEKYNEADAQREFKAALAINGAAAEVYAAVAELAIQSYELDQAQAAIDRALEINPRLLSPRQLQADIHFSNCEPQKAVPVLEAALKANPIAAGTLGRLAAAYAAVDGARGEPAADSRAGKLIAEVLARNPHDGEFFAVMGESFDRLRRYPSAATAFDRAIEVMPQLLAPRSAGGMVLMRLGEEERGQKVLQAAFAADPFNVRVNNTLKVLEVLDGYETLETAHFRVRFDPKADKFMARYAAAWLEEVYPQLCKQMGFEPKDKSLFEIFNKAKNTDGHGWFSARMVGMPHVHTIGACAGKMVAMQSPVGGQKFNWGRVLKHEFIHVLNLQQTNFNIPHWYTEALATLNEGYPRPESWNQLLVERFKNDKLFDLETINFGFIRAHSGEEWNLAYCQAELYAEYMLKQFGEDALAKMLAAYADNLTTREAIPRAFNVDQADFERGYKKYIGEIVAGLSSHGAAEEKSLTELQAASKADPKNSRLLAELALAQLRRKQYPEARRLADAARKLDAREQLAAYVRARLHLLVGENAEALKMLEDALDIQAPQSNLLGLLAGLRLRSENYSEAARLYELGAQREPETLQWSKSLAAVYLKSGEKKKLAGVLVKLAENDADDLVVRKKLAQLALEAGDYATAEQWAYSGIQIDVMDLDLHRWRAEAAVARQQPALAVDEYQVAIELAPDELPLRLGLATTLRDAGRRDEARAATKELLQRDPKYPGADALLQELQ